MSTVLLVAGVVLVLVLWTLAVYFYGRSVGEQSRGWGGR